MSSEVLDERIIGMVALVVVLTLLVITFMTLFFKERSKNSREIAKESSNDEASKNKESNDEIQTTSTESLQKNL